MIDFSSPSASVALASLTARAGVAHVIGTTGLSEGDLEAIAEAAQKTVIVRSGNMSLGVNLLAVLVSARRGPLGRLGTPKLSKCTTG